MKPSIKFTPLLTSLLIALPSVSHAQFGNLLQQLQKLQVPGQAPGQAPGQMPGMGAPTANKGQGGLMPSDQWCNQQAGVLAKMKIDTGVIGTEFKVASLESLQDEFQAAFRQTNLSKTFPHARFFQASFETVKVRSIYDNFLAFPEPETLAALIQISKGQDQQERADALMALAFLQLQAPQLAISKDRWRELHRAALASEHFTALVFRARINAYGEFGPKNLNQALGDLVSAGGLKQKYRQNDGGPQKEFDKQNYELIHSATAKDIYNNEPNMPYRQQWQGPAQMAMQIEQAQQSYARQLPNTRVGRMYAEASRINNESVEIGNNIIKKTQGGNQLAGQLEGLKSLRESAPGEKPVFEDVSPEIQAMQIKMIAKAGSVDDEQKRMLAQAQEKRLVAQGIISQSYSELLSMLMANMSGDMVKMAAPLPALTQANNALIQSCIISTKWEQAMRAKDVPKVDAKKAETAVADLSKKYAD
jgi:hypothetical protein